MTKNSNSISIAMVGCGEHSHIHAQAAAVIPEIKFVSCCDLVDERAQAWAEQYQCESYFTDIEEMINKTKPDAVILCTWPKQHQSQIETCLSLGIKNILCEKSLALSGDEALAIWNAAQQKNALVIEAEKYRHHPAIRKLERILTRQDIGPIDSIRAIFSNYEPEEEIVSDSDRNWRYKEECGGGVAYDWMSYLVNGCNHFSGSLPKRVFASGNISEKYGHIESSKTANFSQELHIACAQGRLTLPISWGIFGDVTISETHRKEPWDFILTDTYRVEHIDSFVLQLKNFVAVIRGEEKPLTPLHESVINIFTIDALVRSLKEKKIVDIKVPELSIN